MLVVLSIKKRGYYQVNISKLKQGMVFKNYKELCIFLEMPIRDGKSKKLQLAELERFVEFHKVGNKFIVDEVLKVPAEKVDKRKDPMKKSNNATYSNDIQALIISILAGADGHTVFFPTNRLLKVLDMVNCNYNEAKAHIPKLAELTRVPEAYCYDFFNTNNVQLKKKLMTALKGLRNRALIMFQETISVCVLVQDVEFTALGDIKVNPKDKKKSLNNYHREHREATELEQKIILRTEEEVLEEFKCSTLQYVFLTGRWNEFQKKVNTRLIEKANIEYYYDSYRIVYNLDSISKAHLKQLEMDEKESIKNNLNSNIKKMVGNYAKTNNKRASKKENKNTIEELQATSSYVDHMNVLNNVVISRDAKDIRKDLVKPLVKAEQVSFNDMPF